MGQTIAAIIQILKKEQTTASFQLKNTGLAKEERALIQQHYSRTDQQIRVLTLEASYFQKQVSFLNPFTKDATLSTLVCPKNENSSLEKRKAAAYQFNKIRKPLQCSD